MAMGTEALLDKLYNLRGEDSEILREMEQQRTKAEETKEKTTEQKGVLQREIKDLKELRSELEEQGEKFKEVLQGINREDYATVLNRLRIDFDPQSLLEKLDKNLPKTIDNVERDTKKSEEELIKVEDEMNRAITSIEELGIRKDAALANQEKLNEYIELALSGRINITRDSITSLLEEFSFSEEEQREAAKILMFPEDALFAYDEKIKAKDKTGKSISEVIQEAKTISEEEPVDEAIPADVEEDPKEELILLLKNADMDYLDFALEDLEQLMEHFDKDLMQHNLEILKANNLAYDILINHVSLLYDKDLDSKIAMLLNTGKNVSDIYLYPKILVKYDKDQLEHVISLLQASGLDPKSVPLMVY